MCRSHQAVRWLWKPLVLRPVYWMHRKWPNGDSLSHSILWFSLTALSDSKVTVYTHTHTLTISLVIVVMMWPSEFKTSRSILMLILWFSLTALSDRSHYLNCTPNLRWLYLGQMIPGEGRTIQDAACTSCDGTGTKPCDGKKNKANEPPELDL